MLRATEPLIEDAGEWRVLGQRFEELADGLRSASRDAELHRLSLKLDELAGKFLNARPIARTIRLFRTCENMKT